MKGFSFTRCDGRVPLIEVRAEVWKKRWWGYQHVGLWVSTMSSITTAETTLRKR